MEAVEKTRELRPTLVLMDVSMPVMNGLEAVREMRRLGLATKIIILTMHDTPEMNQRAKDIGADACLTKTSSPDEIVACIAALLNQSDS